MYCLSADLVEFSDEEGYGKYLDLHECYVKYVNLKGIEVCYICALLSWLCKKKLVRQLQGITYQVP